MDRVVSGRLLYELVTNAASDEQWWDVLSRCRAQV